MSELLAVYGSLLSGLGALESLGLDGLLEPRGACTVPGRLFDLGAYPGLVAGDDRIVAELHAVRDPRVLPRLDRFEGYEPRDPAGSLYVRRRVRLVHPDLEAWVYLYNGDVSERRRIASGDWRRHLASGERPGS